MNINQLESFSLSDAVKFHNKLNPKLWDKSEHIHPEIKDQLLAIAEDFAEYVGINHLDIKDITVSGSNAAFSYTPHSDIDLHLIVDFADKAHKDIYRELFDAKKSIYNKEHDIKITNKIVEQYIKIASDKAFSIDPVILKIREMNDFDKIIDTKIHYILEDNSIIAIDIDTQYVINNLLENKLNVVEFMSKSSDNFLKILDVIIKEA